MNQGQVEYDVGKIVREITKAALETEPATLEDFYKAAAVELYKDEKLDRWTRFKLGDEIMIGLHPRMNARMTGMGTSPVWSSEI